MAKKRSQMRAANFHSFSLMIDLCVLEESVSSIEGSTIPIAYGLIHKNRGNI